MFHMPYIYTNAMMLHADQKRYIDAAAAGSVVLIGLRKNRKPRAVMVSVDAAKKAGLIEEVKDGD